MSYKYKNRGVYGNASKLKFRMLDFPLFFQSEKCLNVIQTIVDEHGKFIDFCGIVEDERWINEKRVRIIEDIYYEASLYEIENQYLLIWLMQPDGRHWMDEFGFGMEDDKSIEFYAIIDENGHFLDKFKLFRIDQEKFTNEFDLYIL